MVSYPNPFTNEIAIRINGEDDELARIRVITLAGDPVEEIEEFRLNTDHELELCEWLQIFFKSTGE